MNSLNNEEHNDFGFIYTDIWTEDNTVDYQPVLDEWIRPFIDSLNRSLGE